MKAFIIFALFATPATAQQVVCPSNPTPSDPHDVQLCWVNAAKDVNGNKLPASGPYSLTKTRIQRLQVGKSAACNFDPGPTQSVTVTPSVLAYKFNDLKADTKQCFRIRNLSEDKAGNELYGIWSNVGCKITTKGAKCTVPPAKTATKKEPGGMLVVQ